MVPPRLEALLVCNAVVRDKAGKPTVQGVFDRLYPTSLPAAANFTIFARLRLPQPGRFDAEIGIRSPSGTTQWPLSRRTMNSDQDVAHLLVEVQSLSIREIGAHSVFLTIDGKEVADFRLTVETPAADTAPRSV